MEKTTSHNIHQKSTVAPETYEFSKFSIQMYDEYFCVKFKKMEILYAYAEIQTIDKLVNTVNGITTISFSINTQEICDYKKRHPLYISIRPKDRRDILLFEHVCDLILTKKVKMIESGAPLVYPDAVRKVRDLKISQKPFGTNGWSFLFQKALFIPVILFMIPIINIGFIIWYRSCYKYIFY